MKRRMPYSALVLALVCAALGSLSGDEGTQRESRVVDAATEMLMSDDYRIREKGSAMIREQRSQRIAALKGLILDKDNFVHRPKTVVASMSLLGEMRAIESVELLVQLIDYPYCAHPDAKTPEDLLSNSRPQVGHISLSSALAPPEERYPAVSALISIGEPCLDKVIEGVKNSEAVTQRNPLVAVLKGLEGHAPVRERLGAAFSDSSGPERERLKQALALLDPDSPSLQELQLKQLQETWDQNREPEKSGLIK